MNDHLHLARAQARVADHHLAAARLRQAGRRRGRDRGDRRPAQRTVAVGRRTGTLSVIILLLLVALAGCGNGASPTSPATSPDALSAPSAASDSDYTRPLNDDPAPEPAQSLQDTPPGGIDLDGESDADRWIERRQDDVLRQAHENNLNAITGDAPEPLQEPSP